MVRARLGGESDGLVPTPAWRKKTFTSDWDRAWNPGDAIQLAIGQKDILVTPLQMTRFYALIANGGTLVVPHVGAGVYGQDGTLREKLESGPGTKVQLDPYMLAAIQQGLLGVTQSPDGTAYAAFKGFPVQVAGKTGTAEKLGKRDFAWFAGYAPASDPKLVVVCVIEQGGFGSILGNDVRPLARIVPTVRRLLDGFRAAGLPVPEGFDDFYRAFEWMGVQRHIKVLGIFARLFHRDGKDGYLNDIPLVMEYTRKTAYRYKEFAPLIKLLDTLQENTTKVGFTF